MNELHLFAGAGGGILGGLLLGHRPVCAVEIEPYCRKVLLQRQRDGILPWFPIWNDVRTFDGKPWNGKVDIVCGGFPCQAWSNAAAGKNKAANMWPEMLRIVGEVCPSVVFAENVDEGAIAMAQKDLTDCGYKTARCKLSAGDLGADHHRPRWWLLAHTYNKGELLRKINAEMGMLPQLCNGIWQTDPDEPRVADGVAHRMDRFKTTGNGQIPLMVAIAYRILAQEDL